MKTQLNNRSWLPVAATLAAILVSGPMVRADWGSLHANNRSAPRPAIERREAVRHEAAHPTYVRHVDIEPERHHAFYWSRFHAGMPLTVLPVGYVQASVGGVGYYYYDGVYYQPTTVGNYIVVAPPIGAIVPQLPEGAEAIVVGPDTYYYAGGAFYLQQSEGFQVVPAPLGVTVPILPDGAAQTVVNGVLYYLANNVYYLPVMQGGITAFVTAHP